MNNKEWNYRFEELNNLPHNNKVNIDAQNSYYKTLMRNKPGHFKDPSDYPVTLVKPEVKPVDPIVPPIVDTNSPDHIVITRQLLEVLITQSKVVTVQLEVILNQTKGN